MERLSEVSAQAGGEILSIGQRVFQSADRCSSRSSCMLGEMTLDHQLLPQGGKNKVSFVV